MLTVLVATLGLTRRAAVGLGVVAGLAFLLATATDLGIPVMAANVALAGAIALTAWKWIVMRGRDEPRLLQVDRWLERIGRALLLLLAAFGFWTVASEILADKPGWPGPVYVLIYLVLLCPLFLAVRIGLEPGAPGGPRNAAPTI